ncbi:type II toxin-antitoxin system death-on-curing family toxin [Kitasatospora kazusensis]|uniref:Type II toxin-antitoxin system death-on-curing family toxin n=1 Tax=Kitasatospora kazusensis TaxID=407974 RepID=A0ABN2ZL91_9ACTN
MSARHLSAEDVLTVSGYACEGAPVIVRDLGLLESAAHRPGAEMLGQPAYPDVFGQAAALLQSLLVNHPLVDGNKRTAWLSCVTFLALRGVELRPDIDAAECLVIGVATGEIREIPVISAGLRALHDTPG